MQLPFVPGFLGLRMAEDEPEILPAGDRLPTIPNTSPPELSLTTTAPAPAPDVAAQGGTWVTVQNNDETMSTSQQFVPYGTPIYGWVDTTPNAEHSTIEFQVVNENAGPPPLPPGVGSDWTMVQAPAHQYEWGSAPAPAPVYVAPWSQTDDVAQIAPTLPRAVDVIQDLSPPPAVAPVPQVQAPAPSPAPQAIPVVNSGGGNVTMPGQFLPNQTVPRQTALPAADDYGSADGAPTLPGQSQASGGFGMLLAVAGLLLSNS